MDQCCSLERRDDFYTFFITCHLPNLQFFVPDFIDIIKKIKKVLLKKGQDDKRGKTAPMLSLLGGIISLHVFLYPKASLVFNIKKKKNFLGICK